MNINALKGKRVAQGLKQEDVYRSLGVAPKTFSDYENSEICKFSIDQICILAKLYKLDLVDVNEIFFDNQLPNGKAV